MNNKTSLFVLIALAFLMIACAPAYVVPSNGNGGYDSGYVQPLYQPGLALVIVGGQSGYYDSDHSFHTTVVLNGSSGYYDSRNHFVSSSPAVRDAAINHKPFYSGPATARSGPMSGPGGPRNPGGLNGSMGRGSAGPAPFSGARPSFGSGPGSAAVGNSSRAATPAPRQSLSGSSGRGRR